MKPTDVLELLDNALFVVRHSAANGGCRCTLHNQTLGIRGSAYAFMRDAADPWRRSFEMRGEEADSLASEILAVWQATDYRCTADCDCNTILERAS